MGRIALGRPKTWELKVSNPDLKMNLPLTHDVKTFTAYGVNAIYVFA